MMDGMACIRLADNVTRTTYEAAKVRSRSDTSNTGTTGTPNVSFVFDEDLIPVLRRSNVSDLVDLCESMCRSAFCKVISDCRRLPS